MIYINEPFCWDSTIDDLLSISYFNLGMKDEALFYVNKALEYDKTNERLIKNKEIFQNSWNTSFYLVSLPIIIITLYNLYFY